METSKTSSPSEDMTTRPVLGYWAIRGLGQQLRCQFAYCGVDFEDKLYEVHQTEGGWDRNSWLDVKQTFGMDYPNLPYIIDGQTMITETVAIHRYIAKKYMPSLLGNTAAEMGRVEMLLAQVQDIKGKATTPAYASEKEGDELKDMIADSVHPVLARLVEVTEGSTWIAGNNLTWLDFFYAEVLEYMDAILDGRFSAEFPSTRDYLARFRGLERVAAYYASAGVEKQAFNNKMAKLGQLR